LEGFSQDGLRKFLGADLLYGRHHKVNKRFCFFLTERSLRMLERSKIPQQQFREKPYILKLFLIFFPDFLDDAEGGPRFSEMRIDDRRLS